MFLIKTFLLLLLLPSLAMAMLPYEHLWNSVLEQHVVSGRQKRVSGHLVKYKDLGESQTFQSIVRYFKSADLSVLKTKDDQLAFWLNVYNVSVVNIVLAHYPLASIKDAGTMVSPIWTKQLITVAGTVFSLKEIEDNILKSLKDPRYHFALYKGSLSGADLRREAYTAKYIDIQLDEQTRDFLNNKSKGLKSNKGTKDLEISRLFKWNASDFDTVGGIELFIRKYVNTDYDSYTLSYLNYNWMLDKK